eukprot:3968149-Pyramimonas_sp.AAC.1
MCKLRPRVSGASVTYQAGLSHSAVYIDAAGGATAMTSYVRNCAVAHSMSGAIVVEGEGAVEILGNVVLESYDASTIKVMSEHGSNVADNLALGTTFVNDKGGFVTFLFATFEVRHSSILKSIVYSPRPLSKRRIPSYGNKGTIPCRRTTLISKSYFCVTVRVPLVAAPPS